MVPADRHFWLLLHSSQKVNDKMTITYKVHYRKQRIEKHEPLPKNRKQRIEKHEPLPKNK
jgi:hypothetical protein